MPRLRLQQMARLCHQGGLYLLLGWMGTEGLG
jgi:hypothetical protein